MLPFSANHVSPSTIFLLPYRFITFTYFKQVCHLFKQVCQPSVIFHILKHSGQVHVPCRANSLPLSSGPASDRLGALQAAAQLSSLVPSITTFLG